MPLLVYIIIHIITYLPNIPQIMFKEIKKLITPKKLWILRLYIALLTLMVEFLLASYVFVSIYNLITSDNALGDLILGYAGLYLVWVCLAILFIVQVISMFLNIHDNIEDVRNKAVNPNFVIDLDEEKEKGREKTIRSIATIIIIVLSVILSFVNLNRNNKDENISHQEDINLENTTEELISTSFDYNSALNQIFDGWGFLSHFKSVNNLKEKTRNEVCDEEYCLSFIQYNNLLIVSYYVKNSIETGTKIYDMGQKKIIENRDFYVDEFNPSKKELNISKQGIDNNGRYINEGKVDLSNIAIVWGDKEYDPVQIAQ